MSAQLVVVAQAVVDELNQAGAAGLFDQDFTATRKYVPLYELADLTTIRITVIGVAETSMRETRQERRHTYTVEVGVQKKLDRKDESIQLDEQVDDLVEFVEGLADYFWSNRLTNFAEGRLKTCDVNPSFSDEHLDESGVFSSLMTLTYELLR